MKRYQCSHHVHCSTRRNSQDVETAPTPTGRGTKKENGEPHTTEHCSALKKDTPRCATAGTRLVDVMSRGIRRAQTPRPSARTRHPIGQTRTGGPGGGRSGGGGEAVAGKQASRPPARGLCAPRVHSPQCSLYGALESFSGAIRMLSE